MENHRAGFFVSPACNIENERNPFPVLAAAQRQLAIHFTPEVTPEAQQAENNRHFGRTTKTTIVSPIAASGSSRPFWPKSNTGPKVLYPVRRNGFLASAGAST
jgi:hypothetical protein